jgi:hypothetical protein
MPDDTVEGAELALAVGPNGRLDPETVPLSRALNRRDLPRSPVRDSLAAAALAAVTRQARCRRDQAGRPARRSRKPGYRDVMGSVRR